MMRKQNLFVIGLDDFRLQQLRRLPQAEHCAFHPLLEVEAIRDVAHCDLRALLHEAVDTLAGFRGSVNGIASDWGFPASVLVPILAARFGLPSASLEAVLKCEHSYWSRCEQAAVVPDQVPRFQAFDPFDDQVAEQLGLEPPYWIQSFESFRSDRIFPVHQPQDLHSALAQIRREESVLSASFRWLLENFEVPAEIAQIKENCVAEAMVGGTRCTFEGYVHDGKVQGQILSAIALGGPDSSFVCRDDQAGSLQPQVEPQVLAIARVLLKRFGLDQSLFKLEFFYNQRSGQIWLLEIAPRLSQGRAERFERAFGLSPLGVMVDLALGREPAARTPHGKPQSPALQPAADDERADEPSLVSQAEISTLAGSGRPVRADLEVAGSHILVVDDQEHNRTTLETMLRDAGFQVDLAGDSDELFARLRHAKPDLILLDIRLPGDDGFQICERLQATPEQSEIPVIFVTAMHKDAASIARAFAAGGVDFITRPFFPEELTARVQTHLRLKRYREHLEALTRVDPLTGLLNRRAMCEHLEAEKRRAQRTGLIYALVLADIDHFKPVNDNHGHRCGDIVLTGLAQLLGERVRRSERVGRWGGEEFLLLLPDTDAAGAAVLAEDLRQVVAATPFSCGERTLQITLSFGIMADSGERPIDACLSKADVALYAAKNAGRNCCITHADAARC
jgi:diguanylate cyclase (GGDEF)-like protein